MAILTTYIEDVGGLKKDDLLQLYAKVNSLETAEVSGYSIWASYAEVPTPIPAGPVTA